MLCLKSNSSQWPALRFHIHVSIDMNNVFLKTFFSDASGGETGTRKLKDVGDQSTLRTPPVSFPLDSVPGPSHVLSEYEQIDQLVEMFPETPRNVLSTSLDVHGTVARAAISLSTCLTNDNEDSDSDLTEPVFLPRGDDDKRPASLPLLLEELQGNLSTEREKLKVDEDDFLNDAMTYYKAAD